MHTPRSFVSSFSRLLALGVGLGGALAACAPGGCDPPVAACGSRDDCRANEQCVEGVCVATVAAPDAGVSTPRVDPPVVPDAGPLDGGAPEEAKIRAFIDAPLDRESFDGEEPLMFLGHVVLDDVNPSTVNVTLASERDGVVWSGMLPETQGLRIPVENLSAGFHRMVLTATSTTGETGRAAISIGVCRWSVAESFDEPLDPNIWETFGDAYRASGGWLEMTGNLTHKKGSIFNIGRELNRGDTRLRFKVSTGQCFTPGTSCRSSDGADGFAMSVFDVDTVAALEALVADAGDGGCLMYGVSGVCGTHVVGGFHIEFDTWNNLEYDPTDADHVAITLDGNPGNHVLWTPIGDLENNQWHQVEVALAGEHIEVELDSHVVIEGDVPGFSFKGGFIGFSGTTGNLTNYHRFDDLQVEENCRF